ncbi:hypothetical protein PS1_044006 [Malus domestica]
MAPPCPVIGPESFGPRAQPPHHPSSPPRNPECAFNPLGLTDDLEAFAKLKERRLVLLTIVKKLRKSSQSVSPLCSDVFLLRYDP